MTIDFSTLLTVISVFTAVYFAFKNNNRANDHDVSRKAEETAILSQKLDSISDDTKEIRKDIADTKLKVTDLSERVIIVEQSAKSAHHRIDRFEENAYETPSKRKRKR